MRRFLCIPVAIVAGLAGAGSVSALTPVSQDRHVHASNVYQTLEGIFPYEETESAPDLGHFSAAIDGVPFSIPVIAIHDSSIGSVRLEATGTAIADPDEDSLTTNHTQESESVYHVDFDLSEDRSFTLNGQLNLFANACEVSTRGHIRLTGPGGVVAEVQDEILTFPSNLVHCDPCVVSLPLSAGGLLPSGSYTLEAVVDSYGLGRIIPSDPCENVFASSSFSVDLRVSGLEVPALPGPAAALAGFIVCALARRALLARAPRQSAATSASPSS